MRVSVFGIGYVGAVSSACLAAAGHTVIAVDVAPAKVDLIRQGRSPIVEATIDELIADAVSRGQLAATLNGADAVAVTDLSLICVGTPSAADGGVAFHAVDSVIAEIGSAIAAKDASHSVAMRSTLPPGAAEERIVPALERASRRKLGKGLRYYSNPEFLREGSAVRDFLAPPFTLVGAPAADDAAPLCELYASIAAPLHVVPYRVAEGVKYLSNAYHAVKLAFANEAGAVLAANGVDAPEAFRLFCEDRILNISPAYLRPGFAFGGSCLPKDLRGFLALGQRKSVAMPLLSHVLPSNAAIVDRAFELIARHGRQRIGLFGLAFKQGTDDLRESPLVLLAERLIGKGYELSIFDRAVKVSALLGSNRSYIDREIPHLERLMADSPAATLAGTGVAVIGHIGVADRPALLEALDGQAVVDLADIPELRARPDIDYQGICW
jgi:GDP-mannose 6-dehydrogenase